MAGNVMHVVQYDSYDSGAAGLKHVEVPVPTPKKDEVLLKLEATSINPIDWKIQKGMLRPLLRPKFLFIPTTDVGGEVVEVGSNVKSFKRGDKVVAMVSTQNGGLIALQAVVNAVGVKLDGTGPRNNILVTAASGGVSHYAFQLAKLGNTDVTATCGARNFDFVKSLGADEVLNYKTPEGAALKSPPGQKYNAVIHLKKLTFSKIRLVLLLFTPNKENLEFLVKLVKEGKLKTAINSKHPLSKAEDAWSRSIDGHATGKIIVEP
ncbi:putative quinone-oxidoreductase -like protein, chloroplastic [Capsicum annuum]|nr:putative quinone-oxidoreductase -like protein, chloroplastic [Capsicum annuum]